MVFRPSAIIAQDVTVPDISFYQDKNTTARGVDFQQMKLAGAKGVIIRAGQNLWEDEDFRVNWIAAKAAGLPRGSYYFLDPRVRPQDQADKWTQMIYNDKPELDIWADYEAPDSWGGNYRNWDGLYNFLARLKVNLPNQKISIYTGFYYWLDHSPAVGSASLDYFKRYKINLAWYTINPANVRIPAPWTNDDLLWWQYTADGNGPFYGVESLGIDLNYFNGGDGSLQVFKDYFRLSEITPPPPIGGTVEKWKVIGQYGLNLRTGKGTAYPILVHLEPGEFVWGVLELSSQWVNFSKYQKAAGAAEVIANGWCAAWPDATTPYLQRVPEVPPPVEKKITKAIVHFDDATTEELFPQP
jgi:GH25 family lysozyme M1 (1,4-beta-N-acetylmuramidase)